MKTSHLLIVLLLLGGLGLFAWQNATPTLPLVFLGIRTIALPLAVWLLGAIALGVLTALLLNILANATSAATNRRRTPKRYGRRLDTDTAPGISQAAHHAASGVAASQRSANRNPRRTPAPPGPEAAMGGEWQEWTNLQSPSQWEDWERVAQASAASTPAGRTFPGWGRQRQVQQQQQQVDNSWQELSQGWENLEDLRVRSPGVSPVQDTLDELEEGWEDLQESPSSRRSPPPREDFEASQSPKQVYRDGSIYSSRYRDGASQGDRPRPTPDEPGDAAIADWQTSPPPRSGSSEPGEPLDESPDQGPGPYAPETTENDLQAPQMGPDGVVDADYRVIIPPYRPLTQNDEDDDDEDWVPS